MPTLQQKTTNRVYLPKSTFLKLFRGLRNRVSPIILGINAKILARNPVSWLKSNPQLLIKGFVVNTLVIILYKFLKCLRATVGKSKR